MTDGKNDHKKLLDPLVRHTTFPDAYQIFKFEPVDIKTALKDGIVVVDTNVLLLPYNTGKDSLDKIHQTYKKLCNEGRLRIPAQVAREFADNRAEKLKTLYQQISKMRDFSLSKSDYPLLGKLDSYQSLKLQEKELHAAAEKYRSSISRLLKDIEDWSWNDPVSAIYRELFGASIIVEHGQNEQDILEQLQYRQENRIPPGYKDAGNEHSGIGDFIIWKTLLKIGKAEERHLIFVTGEEKPDWRYKSDSKALYPRFELIDEYRRHSNGKSFLIISFADLLSESGAPDPVVEEVKKEEEIANIEPIFINPDGTASTKSAGLQNMIGHVKSWLTSIYTCHIVVSDDPVADLIVHSTKGSFAVYIDSATFDEKHSQIYPSKEEINQVLMKARVWPIGVNIVLIAPNMKVVGEAITRLLPFLQPSARDIITYGIVAGNRFLPVYESRPRE